MNTSHHRRFIISIFFIVTLLGIFLPGFLLHHTFETNLDTIQAVPENQYNSPNSAMAKNASAKLSEYEQIKLIAGTWDSNRIPVNSSEANITETQAVELARTAVEELYQTGGYPYHFQQEYGNWYSWSAQCFQCTENAFNTYTAYCYLVSFYHYSSNKCHDVLITENGALLGIRNNCPNECEEALHAFPYSWQYSMKHYLESRYVSDNIPVTLLKVTDTVQLPTYESLSAEDTLTQNSQTADSQNASAADRIDNLSTNKASETFLVVRGYSGNPSYDDILKMTNSTIPENTEIYYLYHYRTPENFVITFIPWE